MELEIGRTNLIRTVLTMKKKFQPILICCIRIAITNSLLGSKSKVFFDAIFSRYILCYYNFHVLNAKLGVSLLEWHVFVKIQVTGEIFWKYGSFGPSHFRVCLSFSPDHCFNLNTGSGRMIFPRDFRPKTEEVSVKTVFSYFHINQLNFDIVKTSWNTQDFTAPTVKI